MMPLIIHFFKELWEMLKLIPWQVYVVLAFLIGAVLYGNHQYNEGYAEAENRYILQQEVDRKFAEDERKRLKNEFERIKKDLIKKQEEGYEKRDKVIADWQSGRLRLKARFSPTSCPATGSDGGTTTGFLGEDVQFLIRESARADGVVRQLQACQGVISEYTKTSK